MNIFVAMLAGLLGKKKPEPTPDYSERMARLDRANPQRKNDQKIGKSQGAPSQRMAEQRYSAEDSVMSNPLHPLNPLSPISIYNDPTPSHSARSSCDSESSSSYSSSYDSGSSSSSCDSGSSSSSSD